MMYLMDGNILNEKELEKILDGWWSSYTAYGKREVFMRISDKRIEVME